MKVTPEVLDADDRHDRPGAFAPLGLTSGWGSKVAIFDVAMARMEAATVQVKERIKAHP
ncbi:MAG TPA: hypothetical protein VIJ91_10925 [Candidatus Dormibacteraeota bacterium]